MFHYLLHPDMRKNDIELLSQNYLEYNSFDISSVLGKGEKKRTISELSEEKQLFYCYELSDIILQLSEIYTHELKELNLYDLFNSIEMPLLKVLSKMELEGINLDVQMLKVILLNSVKKFYL